MTPEPGNNIFLWLGGGMMCFIRPIHSLVGTKASQTQTDRRPTNIVPKVYLAPCSRELLAVLYIQYSLVLLWSSSAPHRSSVVLASIRPSIPIILLCANLSRPSAEFVRGRIILHINQGKREARSPCVRTAALHTVRRDLGRTRPTTRAIFLSPSE